jgi:m7GpppX diphosphatase
MSEANSLLTRFQLEKLLNTDSGGRRIVLYGTIDDKPALLLAERGAFSTDPQYLASFSQLLTRIQNLGDNDIYRWYLANSAVEASPTSSSDNNDEPSSTSAPPPPPPPPDLKINLIYPCTDKHLRKYSFQQSRVVTETPQIYHSHIRPYMQLCREQGRLTWIFNILDGHTEQENVLFRSAEPDPRDDYLLLPDLNWDRNTISSLHLLALVQRRDIWSVRDLRRSLAPWLRRLHSTLAAKVTDLYPGVERDMLKFYVHYQPTYYHFHIHVVHVNLDATATQATGKALGLENVLSQLENLRDDDGDDGGEAGMQSLELTYTVGEESELWTQIFLPLKEGRTPTVGSG